MIRAGGSNSTPGLGGDRAAVPDGNPVRSGGGGGEQRGEHAPAAAELGWPDSMATAAREGERSIDRGEGSDDGEGSSAGVVVGEERRGEDDEAEARERERGRGGFCAWPKSRDPLTSHHLASRAGAAPLKGEAKAIELGTPTPDPDPDPGGRSSHARRRITVINLARARVLCGRVVVAPWHRGNEGNVNRRKEIAEARTCSPLQKTHFGSSVWFGSEFFGFDMRAGDLEYKHCKYSVQLEDHSRHAAAASHGHTAEHLL